MKKNKYFLVVMILIFNYNYSVSQVYESTSENNMLFVKNNNQFTISVKNKTTTDYCDTLASGTIQKFKNKFYTLNSKKNKKLSYKLFFENDIVRKDSTDVFINTSDYDFNEDYLVELIVYDNIKYKSFFLSKTNNTVPYKIEKGNKISLCIYNKGLIVSRDGSEYKGKLYEFLFYEHEVQNNNQKISVNISDLDSCYLKQYVIIDNIVMIDKKYIVWNGVKFEKK